MSVRESDPHLRSVSINLCHTSGIFVLLDKRVFVAHPQAEPEFLRGKVEVVLYTYKPEAPFEPVAQSLEECQGAAAPKPDYCAGL